jgi:hypothetical protein
MLFGRYHPITWRTNARSFRLRHAIPAFFVLFLVALSIAALSNRLSVWWLAPLGIYLILLLGSAVRLRKRVGLSAALATIPIFFLFHLSYGVGTLAGVASLRLDMSNARQRTPA